MSFIQLNGINDVSELPVAPEGQYDLVISGQVLKDSKDGKGKNVMLTIDIENTDRQYAKIFHYLSLPNPHDDAEKVNNKMLMIKRFCHQFGVPLDNGFDTEQLVGCRASNVNLKQDEFENQPKNVIQTDRLPSDD